MELLAKIGIDGSAFAAGVVQVEKGAQKMRASFNSVVKGAAKNQFVQAFGLAAIAATVKNVVEFGSKVNDLSARLGISAETLQRWNFAATQSGATAEDVQAFFEKLAVSKNEALHGSKKAIDSFKALGLSVNDIASGRIEDVAKSIGDLFKNGDPQALIGPLREIGGRGAGGLISAFNDGLQDSFDAADRLGVVLKDDVVSQLDEMGDRADLFALQMKGPVADAIMGAGTGLKYLIDGFKVIYAVGQDIIDRDPSHSEGGFYLNELVDKEMEKESSIQDQIDANREKREKKRAQLSGGYIGTGEEWGLPKTKKEAKEKMEKTSFITDNLAKIGGFTLGQDAAMLNIAKKSLDVLEDIEKNTAQPFDDGL